MSRYAILADVHAGIEALDAVLAEIDARGGARLLVAGDLVGYGPDPDLVVDRLRARGAECIAGNHEGMVLGRIGFSRSSRAAIRAALWTRERIRSDSRAFLAALPAVRDVDGQVLLTHGALEDPEIYVVDDARARAVLDGAARMSPSTRVVVCGHTHRPGMFLPAQGWRRSRVDEVWPLPAGPLLLNPGSVGEAREGAPVARFVLLDVDRREVRFLGVPYARAATDEKIRRAGLLPPRFVSSGERGLAERVEGWRTRLARLRARVTDRASSPRRASSSPRASAPP